MTVRCIIVNDDPYTSPGLSFALCVVYSLGKSFLARETVQGYEVDYQRIVTGIVQSRARSIQFAVPRLSAFSLVGNAKVGALGHSLLLCERRITL